MKVLTIILTLMTFAGCRTVVDAVPQMQGRQTVAHGFETEDGAQTSYGMVDIGAAGGGAGETGDYSGRKVAR